MGTEEKKLQTNYFIDLRSIFKVILKKIWIVILSGLIAGACGFCYSSYGITPKYSSSILLYVNNNSLSLGGNHISISSSEILAAQNLAKTYMVIFNNNTTFKDVIEKANLPYTCNQLSHMVKASTVNDTEVLKITVTSKDAKEAAKIANCIGEVLPNRILEVVDGSSMEVVDYATVNPHKIYPSISKYTGVCFVLGILVSLIILTIVAVNDNTIRDEDYITQTYEYPILARIPDLMVESEKKYEYYYQK